MTRKALKAYIIAPATVDTGAIRRFLKHEDVTADDAYSSPAGSSVVEGLVRSVRSAHFAIAVLDNDSGWTAYELGLCDALGKPVLLIVSPDFSPPGFIASHPQIRTTIGSSDVWQLALTRFIAEMRGDPVRLGQRSSRSQTPKPNSARLRDLAARLHDERATLSPRHIEELALEVLRAASVTVVAQEPELVDRGADFAVWDDVLGRTVGLPLFVELTAGHLTLDRLRQAEWHLAEAMRTSTGRLGLLLHFDRAGERFATPTWDTPFVVRFDLEDFARALTRRSLARILIDRRNKLAHGLG